VQNGTFREPPACYPNLECWPLCFILSPMFSDAVLDHFRNPHNAGDLPDATATVEVTNPVCGDVLRLAVRLESGRIAAARFKTCLLYTSRCV